MIDIGQIFGNGSYNTAVAFKECTISQSVDFVGFTFTYYHNISALGLIQCNIMVSFKYDPALSKFDLTVKSNHNIVRTIVEDIQKITIANNIVLMQ